MSKDIEKLLENINGLIKVIKNQDKMIASLVTEIHKQGEEIKSLEKRTTKLEKRTKESIF